MPITIRYLQRSIQRESATFISNTAGNNLSKEKMFDTFSQLLNVSY